ncbi:MAG: DUF4013 domain-containing protein [Thermoanaerobaculia bacterium]|nr:DUF4013 domain-containing protein [Thermoanaerobaculia bacterium]
MTAETNQGATPPPPPPPAGPRTNKFDLGKAFTFAFQDPRWLEKILIGGLFWIATFLIVGWFFIFGYMARLVRGIVAGVDDRLPEWNDLGEMFTEGLKLCIVAIVWYIPIILVMAPLLVWAIIFDEMGSPHLSEMFAGCMVLIIVPLALVISFVLPAALVRAAIYRTVGAGLAIGPVFAFVRDNFVNFLLSFIVYLAANFIGQMGIVIFCIGVFFTSFWGLAVASHAYGQTWAYGKQT